MLRLVASFAAVLLAAGCSAPPFEITVTNTGDVATYVSAGEGSGLLLLVEEEIGGTWRPLASSKAALCAPQCGLPGAVVCAASAAELNVAHALLPGDSASRAYDTTWWWLDPAGACIRSTALTGPARATVCHGAAAQDADGVALDEPASSGVVGAGGGADVVDPVCEALPFDLSEGTAVEVEIAE